MNVQTTGLYWLSRGGFDPVIHISHCNKCGMTPDGKLKWGEVQRDN